MAPPRKILIADPDPETARVLGPLLRSRGHQVHAARDGSRALEVAVLRFPDLVLFDDACRLIDAPTFLQILRTNPRTEHIPVIHTGRGDPAETGPRSRDSYLKKPYNTDEVLGRIEELFRRADAARDVEGDKEVQGSLSHMSVADLLQVFAMNRKSGRLTLIFQDETADVLLVDGRVRDARGPNVTGEKALFRYLTRREGSFEFLPGRPAATDRIKRTVDDLLLEGMRQGDELIRIREKLPAPELLMFLGVEPGAIERPDPVTAELLRILDGGGCTVAEVIERCSATDYEAAAALLGLHEAGFLRTGGSPRGAEAASVPLLGPAELQGLRQRLLRRRRQTGPGRVTGKLLIASSDPAATRRAADRLGILPGFSPEPGSPAVGTLGHLALGEGLLLDLVALSTHDVLRPLWRPTAVGAIGALLLDEGEQGRALGSWLTQELSLPVIRSEPEAPLDPAPAIRALLQAALRREREAEPPGPQR